MKNFIILSLIVVLQVLGNVLLSHGMRQVGLNTLNAGNALIFGVHVFTNPWIVTGVLFLITFFLSYLAALSRLELSYVLPITASSYVMTAVFAWLLLGEKLYITRWAGTLLISTGVFIVALSEFNAAAGGGTGGKLSEVRQQDQKKS